MFLVRTGAIEGFGELVRHLGGNPAAMLRKSGLSGAQLRDPDTYVSYLRVADLLDLAAESCDEPLFGLRLAERHTIQVLGEVALWINQQETLGQALEHANRHLSLHAYGVHARLVPTPERLELRLNFDFTNATGLRQLMQVSAGQAFIAVSEMAGESATQPRLHLEQERPRACQWRPGRFLREPVFASHFCGVSFPLGWQDRKPNYSEQRLREYFGRRIEELKSLYPEKLPVQVSHLISGLLASGECNLEGVAAALDLHPRVLQRRLGSEGTSFSQLLQQSRQEIAQRQLQHGQLSITELALNLGYADVAVFSRNFRSWTGLSPRQWRDRHRARV